MKSSRRKRRRGEDNRRPRDVDVPDARPSDGGCAEDARSIEDLKEDLLLKIGIHEGPCLAVSLNHRQDYFGRTVNAARVQGLATSRSIFATGRVVTDSEASRLLQSNGIAATPEKRPLTPRHRQKGRDF
jgi:class 3 adenylate cyclase